MQVKVPGDKVFIFYLNSNLKDFIQQYVLTKDRILYFFDSRNDLKVLKKYGINLDKNQVVDLQNLLKRTFNMKNISLDQAANLFLGKKNNVKFKKAKKFPFRDFLVYAAFDAYLTYELAHFINTTQPDVIENIIENNDEILTSNIHKSISDLSKSKTYIQLSTLSNKIKNSGGFFKYKDANDIQISNYIQSVFSEKVFQKSSNQKLFLYISITDAEFREAEEIELLKYLWSEFNRPKSEDEIYYYLQNSIHKNLDLISEFYFPSDGKFYYTVSNL